ncbi:uncharacterized protein METZ01_LOCUS345274, partial [marine metagenome]
NDFCFVHEFGCYDRVSDVPLNETVPWVLDQVV